MEVVLRNFQSRQNLFSRKVASACKRSAAVCNSLWVVIPLWLILKKTGASWGKSRKCKAPMNTIPDLVPLYDKPPGFADVAGGNSERGEGKTFSQEGN